MLPQPEDNPCERPDEKPIENYEDSRATKPRPEGSQSMSKPGKRLDKRRSKTSRCNKDLGRLGELSGNLSLIHISEPTRLGMISYAVFCLKKKKKKIKK